MTNILRPTRVEVNLSNLSHNLKVIRDCIGKTKIMGIVKANAYGHGLEKISQHIEKENVDYIGVAFIEEAIMLRKKGIKTPILVLGAINNQQIQMFIENNVTFTGSSMEKLEAISNTAKKLNKEAKVHLKIDTGMGRIGVQWDRVEPFLKGAFSLTNLKIEGVFSHFADSSNDLDFTKVQLERFELVLKKIYKYIKREDILIHLCNSGAIGNNLKDGFFDMVRSGLMMYGYSPIKEVQETLRPVMTYKTKVSYFKVLGKGLTVGYDRTYTTKEETRIVTLPIGYADGYPRSLSNKGGVIIRDKKYPIVGRMCMDQSMVDIGPKREAYNGDDVLLWGRDGNNFVDLWDVSNLAERSIYEILCSISQRVPRVYID